VKAIVQDTYGSPDVLELRDIDPPVVNDDEVHPPAFRRSWRCAPRNAKHCAQRVKAEHSQPQDR